MKKLTLLLLAAAMLLSLGCAGQPAKSDTSSTPVSTAISAASKPEQLQLSFTAEELAELGKTFYSYNFKTGVLLYSTWETAFT